MNLARNLMLKKEVIEASDELVKETFWQDVFRSLRKDRMAITGGIVIVLFILMAILAPLIAPHDPYEVNLDNQFQKPSLQYWLGTDMFGRDVFSRIIYGSQISLLIGIVPSLITMSIGIVLGIVAGYFGRRTDFIIMTISDMVLSFPSLLLAMVVMYTLGASLLNIFIALSIVGWAGTARVVRAQTLSLKNKEFVEAARAVGVKPHIIMLRHILPNCIP